MKRILILLLITLQSTFAQTANVQIDVTMPSFCLIDIAPNKNDVTLSLVAPTEAGNIVVSTATNNTKYIHITSAVSPGATRSISAEISGTLPGGIQLKLATAAVTSGSGARGTNVPSITLSNSPQNIVTNIGGGFTANGSTNGFRITYSLNINDYSLIRNSSSVVSVIYTIFEN